MRVLITGGAGYIGSVLVRRLLDRDYDVKVVDSGFFGVEHLPPEAEVIIGDILEFDGKWLEDVDGVVHLAGLSNDPMADFSPSLNYMINAAGAAIVTQVCKQEGVRRFVMGSTCSLYGAAGDQMVDEDWPVKPSFPYGISKLMAESAVQCLTDDSFQPIILRLGTVIGWSPRMRYDLVANTMIKTALTEGQITVHNPLLLRPVLDVSDAADAYIRALEVDEEARGTFNIAYDNFSIGQIADEVVDVLRQRGLSVRLLRESRPDPRSYRVSTKRARDILGFTATVSIGESVSLMLDRIQEGTTADFDNPRYCNIDWMKLHVGDISSAR
jgi:nucleoside-diphosphate-sugar epimerase